MRQFGTKRDHPDLKQIVTEASRALAGLDAGRLEELAMSCRALNRDLACGDSTGRLRLARQAREAAPAMDVLARILDVTRGNLEVMHRLRDLRAGSLEYAAPKSSRWAPSGSGHGDD